MIPNIYMFHRIELEHVQNIADIYYKRGMVHTITEIYELIEDLLQKGLSFGTIEQCAKNNNFFHLSFDDGFKEHLVVAQKLKEDYSLDHDQVTFSINVGNSYYQEYTGMDVVYQASINNHLDKICFSLDIFEKGIKTIKQELVRQSPEVLRKICEQIPEILEALSFTFLDAKEVKTVSKLFDIACHSITHRDMTYHTKNSKWEIKQAKEFLEKTLGVEIKTFTYPEGKNNSTIQQLVQDNNFKNALSIRHQESNPFCIGRIILSSGK